MSAPVQLSKTGGSSGSSTASLPGVDPVGLPQELQRRWERTVCAVPGREDPSTLSATVNSVLHQETVRRNRQTALAAFVAQLDAEFGEPEPDQVERFRRTGVTALVLDSEAISRLTRSRSG